MFEASIILFQSLLLCLTDHCQQQVKMLSRQLDWNKNEQQFKWIVSAYGMQLTYLLFYLFRPKLKDSNNSWINKINSLRNPTNKIHKSQTTYHIKLVFLHLCQSHSEIVNSNRFPLDLICVNKSDSLLLLFRANDFLQIPSFFNITSLSLLLDKQILLRIQRMTTWIMQESSKRNFQRETCALAIKLLDIYLDMKGAVETSTIQELGIACLNISSKFNQPLGRSARTNPQIFNHQSILKFEQTILFKTKFHLLIPSHASISYNLLINWVQKMKTNIFFKDAVFFPSSSLSFSEIQQKQSYDERILFEKVNGFYELLDCCTAIKQLFNYTIEDLVYNCFIFYIKKEYHYLCQSSSQFFSILQQELKEIFKQEMLSQGKKYSPIIFGEELQKVIEIPYKKLKKVRTLVEIHSAFNGYIQKKKIYPWLKFHQLLSFQIWKPYYLKVAKESSPQIAKLQDSFQN